MHNKKLAQDYVIRAKSRVKALTFYLSDKNFPDVVREAQEAVELSLKGLLKFHQIDFPRVHDVSGVLLEHKIRFGKNVTENLDRIIGISKDLRRDRELAFYGTEDLLPLEFYSLADAKLAIDHASYVVSLVEGEVMRELD